MPLDSSALLWSVAVPAAVMAGSFVIGCFLSRTGRTLAVVSGWWLAVVVALLAVNQWQWKMWPEEVWQRAIWPLLGWSAWGCWLVSSEVRPSGDGEADDVRAQRSPAAAGLGWIAAGLLAVTTGAIAMPAGDAWADTYPLHRFWIAAVTASCLLNALALVSLATREASRWCLLVALAALGPALALAAANYASLSQWTLAMVAATAVAAAAGLFSCCATNWVVAFPAMASAAWVTTAARFYTYSEYPLWVYAIALFTPAIVGVIDLMIGPARTWTRIVTAAIVSTAMVAAVVARVLVFVEF